MVTLFGSGFAGFG